MKSSGTRLVILAVMGAILLFGGMYTCSGYNKAISLDEQVQASWAQVENQLKRRHDMIPNLVKVVKGYAGHEKDIFENLAKAREGYAQAKSIPGKVKAAREVESTLSRLLMIVENYPNLKANESFLKLQDTLEGTENRIAVERMRYNEGVKKLNGYIRRFPTRIFAGWANVERAEYFEVAEKEQSVPEIDFDN